MTFPHQPKHPRLKDRHLQSLRPAQVSPLPSSLGAYAVPTWTEPVVHLVVPGHKPRRTQTADWTVDDQGSGRRGGVAAEDRAEERRDNRARTERCTRLRFLAGIRSLRNEVTSDGRV
jgi:hypothetical protein